MKRSSFTASEQQPLIDAVRPTEADGALVSAVFSTYGLSVDQPNFFDHDFLPVLLGLGGVRDRGYTAPVTIERKLADCYCALICDAHALAEGGRPSLRVDVIPVGRQLQHAKLVLIHRQRLVRLIVTSANLTHYGYRSQREVAAVLDFKEREGLPATVLREAVEGWRSVLGESVTPALGSALKEAVEAAERLVGKSGHSGPRTRVLFGGGPAPLWRQIAGDWPPGEPLRHWMICSPFWPQPTGGRTPFEAIAQALADRKAECEAAELTIVASADSPGESPRARFPYPIIAKLRAGGFPITRGTIWPALLNTTEAEAPDRQDESSRELHAKWMLLAGPETALLFLGSANFTRRGLGVLPNPETANIEAGVLITLPASTVKPALLLPPVAAGGKVDWEACSDTQFAEPGKEDPVVEWPSFILHIELELDWHEPGAPTGKLTARVYEHAEFDLALRTTGDDAPPRVDVVERTEKLVRFSADAQAVSNMLAQRAVIIRWGSPQKEVLFPVNIHETSKASLPSVLGAHPSEQQLLAYFHGKIGEDDLLAQLEARSRRSGTGSGSEPDAAVSRELQSYIVRDFVESLFGMHELLERSSTSPRAFEQALLGEFSPLKLAEQILHALRTGRRSPTAAAFQFVELVRLVSSLSPSMGDFAPDESALVENSRARAIDRLLKIAGQAARDKEFLIVCRDADFRRYVNKSLATPELRRLWHVAIASPSVC